MEDYLQELGKMPTAIWSVLVIQSRCFFTEKCTIELSEHARHKTILEFFEESGEVGLRCFHDRCHSRAAPIDRTNTDLCFLGNP